MSPPEVKEVLKKTGEIIKVVENSNDNGRANATTHKTAY
jgi:DNA-directed RNA polymerase subunit H (RpoH/RPB5)